MAPLIRCRYRLDNIVLFRYEHMSTSTAKAPALATDRVPL